jgi:hypothetical protein
VFARIQPCREEGESDTESTDEDLAWGGLGVFEYGKKGSAKGLVHALVHVRELLETGGHHGAFCTSVAEAGHKQAIKRAAQFSRIYKSLNNTQDSMLNWVLRQTLFSDVFLVHGQAQPVRAPPVRREAAASRSALCKFGGNLSFTDDWSDLQLNQDDSLPVVWRSQFLSKKVLISREELLVLLRTKFRMDQTVANLRHIVKNLRIRCFGTLTTPLPGEPCKTRKRVGVDCTGRRDFVRIEGTEFNTAMAGQVVVYVPVCA